MRRRNALTFAATFVSAAVAVPTGMALASGGERPQLDDPPPVERVDVPDESTTTTTTTPPPIPSPAAPLTDDDDIDDEVEEVEEVDDDDNSGPGSGGGGEDRSGSNRGPG